jgi:hypothetical protein
VKAFLKQLFSIIGKPIDVLFAIAALPAALVLNGYRRIGSARLPLTTKELKRIGLFPIKNHYYEPLFDSSLLTKPLSQDRDLPGIDLNESGQLHFLSQFTYSAELIAMHLYDAPRSSSDFCLNNPSYGPGEADYLYQFIRAIKPSKIIEVGSGYSTKLARVALLKNYSLSNQKPVHVCVEPYEMKWLEELSEVTVIRKRIEDCDIDWSNELNAGDLLFIDSSHMIRPQGDVLKEYLEILPRLAQGVYVHIHDIFTPKDYPSDWIVNEVRFWNEQYILEALLTNSNRYEVIGALNYLKHHQYEQLKNVCPYLTADREPCSIYLRIR